MAHLLSFSLAACLAFILISVAQAETGKDISETGAQNVTSRRMLRLTSGPFPISKCPAYASQKCDFTLQFNQYYIPDFLLSTFSHDTILDLFGVLFNTKTKQIVYSASTPGVCYFVPERKQKRYKHCTNEFYFGSNSSNYLNANHIVARPLSKAQLQTYAGRCVLMPIATAKIQIAPAHGTTPAQYAYINTGDNNPVYPVHRRCIVFRTHK